MKHCFHFSKKPKKKKRWVKAVIFGGIILLGGLLVVVYSSLFRLTQIQFSSVSSLPETETEIQSFIQAHSGGWGNRSLFLNLGLLEKQILDYFPTLERVSLHRRFPHTLVVALTERAPILEARFADSVFLADKGGFIFQENSSQNDLPILEIEVSSCQKPRVGKFLLPPAPWENLSSIISFFGERKESLSFQPGKGKLICPKRLDIILSPGPAIYFDLEKEADYSLQAMGAFSQQEDFFDWEYLDLRFSNRAYYSE